MFASDRKRKYFTLQQKLDILTRIDRGESSADIERECGVSHSTISGWKKTRSTIEKFCTSTGLNSNSKRQTLKLPCLFKHENELFEWFERTRKQGIPLTGPMIKAKALEINEAHGGNSAFVASEGWLQNWKNKYGIRRLTVCGENQSLDTVTAEEYKETILDIVTNIELSKEQIYNCNETGLYFKSVPSKNLVSKDRVTVLVCSNANGTHKIPLLVIGKSENPRALNDIEKKNLPVSYKGHRTAWLTTAIFKDWFHNIFVPLVVSYLNSKGLPSKALLIIDKAGYDPHESNLVSGDIQTVFLPPNTTAIIQPMDQAVLNNLKITYQKKLLMYIMEEETGSIVEQLEKITIRDVIYWLAESWDMVNPSLISKSWKALVSDMDQADTNDRESNIEAITHEDAWQAFEKARKYIQQEDNAALGDLEVIKRWQDHAASSLQM